MNKPRILICPLNWGLGHASRCIPIIHALLDAGAEPIIAADKGPMELLRGEFPTLEYLHFPGVEVKYPEQGQNMTWSMLSQTPAILRGIKNETAFIKKIEDAYQLSGLISDNRFGAYSSRIPSVYVSHQLFIQTGNALTDKLAFIKHRQYMQKYTRVWIPDYEEFPGLASALSHGKSIPKFARYIGPLSRLKPGKEEAKIYDACLLLSGPEPQRSILEKVFVEQIAEFPDKKFLLIRGIRASLEDKPKHLDLLEIANQEQVSEAILKSQRFICRSGYSSLMDLHALGKGAFLIPTPGQTEQEYLAAQLSGKPGFMSIKQEHFNLKNILNTTLEKPTFTAHNNQSLQIAVLEFLDLCKIQASGKAANQA